jgi:hypothetical protein
LPGDDAFALKAFGQQLVMQEFVEHARIFSGGRASYLVNRWACEVFGNL